MYYVKYEGTFGFIKPWTAVRDSETFSQQFLTTSILEGIEKKLFPELLLNEQNYGKIIKIKRHRLSYKGFDTQQEVTWAKNRKVTKEKDTYKVNNSIIKRSVLLFPRLYLLFDSKEDAQAAFSQTICLARNEDLMFPTEMRETEIEEFEQINGFEFFPTDSNQGFIVGINRFNNKEMFGVIKVYGNPIRDEDE